ncbi:MAG: competence protein TfoX [Clostridia bacterium]|nr:competence protein TfoX [Clostridia bacterium]
MASTKEYLEYVLEQLSEVDGLRYRPMMGEYLIYCRNRLVGGVYDDRLLVKPTKSALALLPDAPREEPYPGGRPMLLVTEMENKRLLQELLEAVADEVK